jgi:TolA-binding protein
MSRLFLLLIIFLAIPRQLPAQAEGKIAPRPAQAGVHMTDAEIAALAKESLGAEDPAAIRAVLPRLKAYQFKSSKVPERELVLYVQGVLEARLGNLSGAAVPLKKLEKQWPKSPFMGEAQTILAEESVAQKHYKDAEKRLHQALASDMPAERKRRPQELLIWTLVEQGRPLEAMPIVQALRPLEPKEKPTEQGLAAIVEVLGKAGEKEQTDANRKDFLQLFPKSALTPRVDLAWGRLLGASGDAKGAAEVLRKLISDSPKTPQADDARLALASLLTDGSLPDTKDMPSPEALLDEVRKGGKGLPKGAAQMVELRLMIKKNLWEDALNQADHMDPAMLSGQSEGHNLWQQAWRAWVEERLGKGFPGELLSRMKPGAFGALEPKARLGVTELFASRGLLDAIPPLLSEAPGREQPDLRKAALGKAEPEAQPVAVLKLLPARGGTPDEALIRARAEAVLGHWPAVKLALDHARPGSDRITVIRRLLERPIAGKETASQRLAEAEGWLRRVSEKAETREPLVILVADLRSRLGDAKGALALYPAKAADPTQRGWVALMRAQAMVRLGQREQAAQVILAARDEQGFKGQRDGMAKSLGAY